MFPVWEGVLIPEKNDRKAAVRVPCFGRSDGLVIDMNLFSARVKRCLALIMALVFFVSAGEFGLTTRASAVTYVTKKIYTLLAEEYFSGTDSANVAAAGVLSSGALVGDNTVRIAYPDAGSISFAEGEVSAKRVTANYSGLRWEPYSCTVNGQVYLFDGRTAVEVGDPHGADLTVEYRLVLTNLSGVLLQTPSTLVKEAGNQKTVLNRLSSPDEPYMGYMEKLTYDKMNLIGTILDPEHPMGGMLILHHDDAQKNIALKKCFREVILKMQGSCYPSAASGQKLTIYNLLEQYAAEGLSHYYRNYDAYKTEIEAFKGYLDELLKEETRDGVYLSEEDKKIGVANMVECARQYESLMGVSVPDFAVDFVALQQKMDEVDKRLTPPNSMINVSSSNLNKLTVILETVKSAASHSEQPTLRAAITTGSCQHEFEGDSNICIHCATECGSAPSADTCTVTWKNGDGSVLETDYNVAYGTMPEYNGATPVKAADAQYTYTFAGWTPAISVAAGDVTYTATYNVKPNTYTVTWKNEDGSVLETDRNVAYGAMPEYNGATPAKAASTRYTYTFAGWTPALSAVTGNVTYVAAYTTTVKPGSGYIPIINRDGVTTAEQLAERLTNADHGEQITVSDTVVLTGDLSVDCAVTIEGAEKLEDDGYVLMLTDPEAAVFADAPLNVVSGVDGYIPVKDGKANTYSLVEVRHPETGGRTAGSKTETLNNTRYLYLDLDPANGMTLDAFRASTAFSQLGEYTVSVAIAGNDGSALIKTADRMTVTARREDGKTVAKISYVVIVMGDTNCNGKVNSSDAAVTKNISMGKESSLEARMAADVNFSGTVETPKVNSSDVSFVMAKWFAWDLNQYTSNLK